MFSIRLAVRGLKSRFPLSQKYIDFVNSIHNVTADFLEGTTASGKTTVGAGIKFMRMVSANRKKLHVIAAKTTGKAEETIIQQDNGILDLHANARYFGNGDKDYKLPHIKFEDGRAIQPTGQSEHRDEVQFRISIPDAVDGKPTTGAWDPTNDWSYETLTATQDIKSDDAINEKITMYVDDKLVWGVEPDGTEPDTDPTTTTTQPTTGDDIVWGDANCDGKVDISDAVMILQAIANNDVYGVNGSSETRITEQGVINADVYDNGTGMTTLDALTIQRYLVELIDKLPVASN